MAFKLRFSFSLLAIHTSYLDMFMAVYIATFIYLVSVHTFTLLLRSKIP